MLRIPNDDKWLRACSNTERIEAVVLFSMVLISVNLLNEGRLCSQQLGEVLLRARTCQAKCMEDTRHIVWDSWWHFARPPTAHPSLEGGS
jgi:hypothetical protein